MEKEQSSNTPLVRMAGMGKSFDGVSVLRDVNMDLHAGKVLALVGENGAGKSTLMNILGGLFSEYDGAVHVDGKEVGLYSPNAASELGIRLIHQELSLIPAMSSAENIFLGKEIRGPIGLVSRKRMNDKARQLLNRLQTDVDVARPVEHYSIAVHQMVEIAKALSEKARVLIMDEPTSALAEHETDRLFEVIEQLKSQGVAIVYISHRMEEIYRIADRIVVLRDGSFIGSAAPDELPPDKLVQWMVGREVKQTFPERRANFGKELITVENLTVRDPNLPARKFVDDVSFSVREGEIIGLAGLRGAGNSEILWSLFGAYGPPAAGKIKISGRPYHPATVHSGMAAGLALVTNDRKTTGLVLSMDVIDNGSLAALADMVKAIVVLTRTSQKKQTVPALAELNTRARNSQDVGTLSGGNQQKVVLAKWLLTKPKVLLLDEPTRGIDVVAKHEVYVLLDKLAQQGVAIIMTMSELPELLAMSDRILVMRGGRITAEFSHDEATQENVAAAAI